MNSKPVVVIALGSAFALSAVAGEKRIRKADVPNVVLAAVTAKYPKADMTGFAQEEAAGKTVYEVQLKVGGTPTDLIVSRAGKILTEEKAISMKELPDVVRQGLSISRYAKARVLKIEKATDSDKPEAPSYELLVERDRKKHEFVFASNGELTREEAKSQHEN